MSLNNRYLPSHAPGASCLYALDFSAILPPGVGIASGTVFVEVNRVPPTPAADLTAGPVEIVGRRLYSFVQGGGAGTDYRLTWTAQDTLANSWPRATLLLCAATS